MEIRNTSASSLYIDCIKAIKYSKFKLDLYPKSEEFKCISPGDKIRIPVNSSWLTPEIKRLALIEGEKLRIKIKMETSLGTITSGWIPVDINESENRLLFQDSANNNVMKIDVNPYYIALIDTILGSFLIVSLPMAFILATPQLSCIILIDMMLVATIGYFHYINGFKNITTATSYALAISSYLSLLMAVPGDVQYGFGVFVLFFPILWVEVVVCSGILTIIPDRR